MQLASLLRKLYTLQCNTNEVSPTALNMNWSDNMQQVIIIKLSDKVDY